jgi:hypothetical protein
MWGYGDILSPNSSLWCHNKTFNNYKCVNFKTGKIGKIGINCLSNGKCETTKFQTCCKSDPILFKISSFVYITPNFY